MAVWLACDNFDFRGDDAVAAAWLRRAEALLDAHGPCPEEGCRLLMAADIALYAQGNPETALEHARAAIDPGRQLRDAGVEVVGNAILGSALVASGDVDDGLRRLEEAAALAIAERFEVLVAAGWALCHTVSVCTNVGDFPRAGQWCRALHAWSERLAWTAFLRHLPHRVRGCPRDVGRLEHGRGGAVQRAGGHERDAAGHGAVDRGAARAAARVAG